MQQNILVQMYASEQYLLVSYPLRQSRYLVYFLFLLWAFSFGILGLGQSSSRLYACLG